MIDLGWAAGFLPLIGAGFGVGFLVGLTGVGGGALMTPLLISSFGVTPQIAVGTDLLYASITKTAGSWRHHIADHVEWPIVFRLAAGSIPASLILLAAIAFIPLTVQGRLAGKFMTYYDAPHAFGDEEIALAVTIGLLDVWGARTTGGRSAEQTAGIIDSVDRPI